MLHKLPKDDVCLLFSMWGMMSNEQRMLVTMDYGWEREREQFVHVLQDALGRSLTFSVYSTSLGDTSHIENNKYELTIDVVLVRYI